MLSQQEIIARVKTGLERLYGERLERIILYGSRARGDNREDSDFDFMVVLKGGPIEGVEEIFGTIDKVSYPIWEEKYLKINCFHIDSERFHNAKTPLLYWVRKEGKEI